VIAEMITINPFDFFLEEYAQKFPFPTTPARQGAGPLPGDEGRRAPAEPGWLAGGGPHRRGSTVDFLVALNKRLQQPTSATSSAWSPGSRPARRPLELAKGSCRDSGWLLVQILRHLGLAARFVSGYLVQLTADVKSLDGPSGPERDFTDLHAWTEVYLPGAGWVGLDPTSGLFAGEGHIPLACTPDPISAAPITGATRHARSPSTSTTEVERIHEDPRVTKPYTREQWQAIEALGHQVDEELMPHDVRLTMGGEPTFVSIDDMDGDEWNTAALGPTKKLLAEDLLRGCKGRFAPGGLLHIGQGKWYPGEQLPRWALSCYWRKDGEPVWRDDALFGKETHELRPRPEEAGALHPHPGPAPGGAPGLRGACLRGRLVLPVEGAASAGQRGPIGQQAQGAQRAQASGPALRPGPQPGGGLRPAAALVGLRGGRRLEERALDLQGRAPLPDPRRLPHGLPAPARRAPLCAGVRAGPGAGAQPLRARLPPALTLR
jgi:hypothetical protein